MNKDPSCNSNADPVVAGSNTSDWSILESRPEQPPQTPPANPNKNLISRLGTLFQKFTIESVKDFFDAAEVSSAMAKFSKDYADVKETAIKVGGYYYQDAGEYYEVHPLYYRDGKMTLEEIVSIIDEKGISNRISRKDIQSFGDSLFDAVLHYRTGYKLFKEEEIDKLSAIFRQLEDYGFQPPRDSKTLEFMTDFEQGGGEIAKTLGLVDEEDIIQCIVSRVNHDYGVDSGDFTTDNVLRFVSARQNLWSLLDGEIIGELSDVQKAEITNRLPANDRGFVAYSKRIGGGYYRNWGNLPSGAYTRQFTNGYPTPEFWQASFKDGNLLEIEKYFRTEDSETGKVSHDYSSSQLEPRQLVILDFYSEMARPAHGARLVSELVKTPKDYQELFDDSGYPKDEFWIREMHDGEFDFLYRVMKTRDDGLPSAYWPSDGVFGSAQSSAIKFASTDGRMFKQSVLQLTNDLPDEELSRYFDSDGPKDDFWRRELIQNHNLHGIFKYTQQEHEKTETPNPKHDDSFLSSPKMKVALKCYASIEEGLECRAFIDSLAKQYADISAADIYMLKHYINQFCHPTVKEIDNHKSEFYYNFLSGGVPLHTLKEVESIFYRNNLPYCSKIFAVFQVMHPPESLPRAFSNFSKDERRASPILMELADADRGDEMAGLLYSDIFTIAAGSNNRSLRRVLADKQNIQEYMDRKIATADTFNREACKHPFRLQAGDLVKGLGTDWQRYLPNILQDGFVCKEFLGADATSDTTPLDTDLSLIEKDATSFKKGMRGLECNVFGPVWVVLKADENRPGPNRFCVTRRAPAEVDKPTAATSDHNKIEVFYTGRDSVSVQGRTHMGIRTGFASSEVDFFLVEDKQVAETVGTEVAKNGFYIPIVNKHTGRLVFTPEDYDRQVAELSAADNET